ncbi:MAG: hypothetical protein MK212_19640 [Saprospiraceae bacterium]|nr:hypothetical protein [Saprospiraceae bacterium]
MNIFFNVISIMRTSPNPHLDHSHYLVTALWALIFAKCFFFEYLICNYAVPVNSTLFIWSLSILMSTVATMVYFSVQNSGKTLHSIYHSLGKTWSFCGLIIGIILAGAYFINSIPTSILPACIAIIISLGNLVLLMQTRTIRFLFSTLGWSLCAVLALLSPPPLHLLIFALSLTLFTAAPYYLLYRSRRLEIYRALQALHT